ncbi:Pentapeptide repeat protein [Rhodovulum sulfidophilum]|uniref:Pentapeptide repeat protein n=1 Tax=Rhodovulum sulfidophilum TaxID=35806 RepID=A0A0D6B4Q8_RHOSU|nr:Pentapeptide repeat protein [Rhodovulum sulfidophilum]
MTANRTRLVDWASHLWRPDFKRFTGFGWIVRLVVALLVLALAIIAFGAAILTLAQYVGALVFAQRFASVEGQYEAIRNAGLVLAGLIGVPFLVWRSIVAQKQVEVAEQGLITDRLNKAIEGLGAEKTVKRRLTHPDGTTEIEETTEPNIEVRIGAIYALERISQDSDRDHVNVMEILCAYICENSHRPPSSQPPSRSEDTDAAKASLSELTDLTDVQTALTVLGRRAESRRRLETAAHYRLSLSRCNLAKCDLSGADFSHAKFAGSNLNDAFLYRSRFRDCNFTSASMKRVQGYDSIFEGAVFEYANLSQAIFNRSRFLFSPEAQIGANFSQAQMEDSVVAFSGVRGSDRWALGANFAEASWKNAIIIGFESQRDTNFGFRTARTGTDTPPRPATIHQGLAFRDCILGADHIGTLDLERCFGDGTVVLMEPIIRPPHWPSEALSPTAFDRECARWRADPASYVPPQDRA